MTKNILFFQLNDFLFGYFHEIEAHGEPHTSNQTIYKGRCLKSMTE